MEGPPAGATKSSGGERDRNLGSGVDLGEGNGSVIKGWRIFFYSVIGIAVLSIGWITVKFIMTERLVKATGDPELAIRQQAATRIMTLGREGTDKPIKFLQGQPQTVRDNVVWSLEQLCADPGRGPQAVDWIVSIARDMSGDPPTTQYDSDASRLTVERLGDKAFDFLVATLAETTRKTLERERYAHRRAVAARLLGVLKDERAVQPLILALRDEYSNVRQQAAAALARIDTPEAQAALQDYLNPLLGVLQGQYVCFVRADSEGRIRTDVKRDDLIYGPFVVTVKPHQEATEADLERQQDSALTIQKREEERQALTRKRLQQGAQGQVVQRLKGETDLKVESVTLARTGLTVEDPKGKQFDLVEGEPMDVIVGVRNQGPGDLWSDFYVSLYAAAPYPKTHVDMPEEGPHEGERAADNRALAGIADTRHVQTLFHADRPETKDEDDTRNAVHLTISFNDVEANRIEALRQLMYVGHEMCIPALGAAISDSSYTVRRQAAEALEKIIQAQETTAEAKATIAKILCDSGLTSQDAVVRCTAADALRFAHDPASAEALHALLLSDADPTVRLVAQRAIADLPGASKEKMLPALVSRDAGARRMAPRLFEGQSESSILRSLLFSPDPAVAREVLRTSFQRLESADLVAALQLPDPRARALAMRALSDRVDPRAKVAMIRSLQDSDAKVREAAATGLGKLLKQAGGADPAIVEALVEVVQNEAGDYVGVPADEEPADPTTAVTTDKRTRAAAVTGLLGCQDPAAVTALTEAMADTNPTVLEAVLPAVADGQVKDQSAALIKIAEDAKTLGARLRQKAILALWHSGASDSDALDALVGLLNDPSETVKTTSAVALIGLGDSRGNKVLRDQVTNKNQEIRREAAMLLATLPQDKVDAIDGLKPEDRDGLQILIDELYLGGSLPVNFRFLCRSLKFLGEQQSTTERLKTALSDAHPVLRAAGLTVLSSLDALGAKDDVLKGLNDSNEFVRAAAAEAAGLTGLEEAAPRLEKMVATDPAKSAHDQAANALARLDSGG